MEIFAYTTIILIAFMFSFKAAPIRSRRIFFFFFGAVYLSHSAIIRFAGFDTDIIVYANTMGSTNNGMYYLKEPVVWLGQRYLHRTLNSEIATFLVSDAILGLFLFAALKKLRMPQYAFFSILAFFPFILGIQNIYRQWAASIMMLLSIAYSLHGSKKSWLFLAISILSHNATALLAPIIMRLNGGNIKRFAAIAFLAMMPFIIFYAKGTKSSAATGANLGLAYLILLMLFFIFFLISSSRLVISKRDLKYYFTAGSAVLISFFSMILLSPTGAERMSMLCLMILYPFICLRIEERFKEKLFFRVCLTLGGFLPLLAFEARHFLFSTPIGHLTARLNGM